MSSEAPECIIRPASSLQEAHDVSWPLMQSLGWNRASDDCKTHYISATAETGPSGWLVVASKTNPEKAEGCVVLLVYPNSTGWLGLFMLNQSVRGLGWGGKLFQAGLDVFKSNGTDMVGLDAVEEQVSTYARRGFVEKAKIKIMVRKSLKENNLPGEMEHVHEMLERCTDLSQLPPKILVQSDLEHSGMERRALWTKEALFDRDDTIGLGLVKEGEQEELEGWIIIRSCEQGRRFGPLYADSAEIASFLLRIAMRRLGDEDGTLAAEVWPNNPKAVQVFEDAGWEWAGLDYHRMWLDGKFPEAQKPGGKADKEVYAVFDAAEG
ncbi:hypothetical protein EJ08DRAFT_606066 [Tothia fuscella]|uniref:N-acetyltransferase domain-containing protein n=1 Tax=Tothia fuscella TaxID=1048955 RepID=A0A9P4NZQ3_9PEZI|nr:hypothetical protein EJ08DRAFT_606066 [Tothia fuscella]